MFESLSRKPLITSDLICILLKYYKLSKLMKSGITKIN